MRGLILHLCGIYGILYMGILPGSTRSISIFGSAIINVKVPPTNATLGRGGRDRTGTWAGSKDFTLRPAEVNCLALCALLQQ